METSPQNLVVRRMASGEGGRHMSVPEIPEVLERLQTPRGELVLRRRGTDFEVIANGTFLMATHGGRSERAMVDLGLQGAGPGAQVLVGGLGVGYTLAACLSHPAVSRVTVVELEEAVVRWNRSYLAGHNGGAASDPRVDVVIADLADFLGGSPRPYQALLLDADNGPGWLVHAENQRLYQAPAVARLQEWLAPGGAAVFWSAQAEPAFHRLLTEQWAGLVSEHRVPAPGGDDYLYLARKRV